MTLNTTGYPTGNSYDEPVFPSYERLSQHSRVAYPEEKAVAAQWRRSQSVNLYNSDVSLLHTWGHPLRRRMHRVILNRDALPNVTFDTYTRIDNRVVSLGRTQEDYPLKRAA